MNEPDRRVLSFEVYGEPQSKRDGASKVAMVNGRVFVRRFSPAKVKDWIGRITDKAIDATEEMLRPVFPKGPVSLGLKFFFPKPKSARRAAVAKDTKPDADRLQCAVQDALQGIVYTTDSQVAEWRGVKVWTEGPAKVVIEVKKVTEAF